MALSSRTVPKSPFSSSLAAPGYGNVVLSLLPPSTPTLSTLTFQYPLKLMTRKAKDFDPDETKAGVAAVTPVHLYLLTYGGGLLPGDRIDVKIALRPRTRLVITTPQGSTKIYKTNPGGVEGIGGRGANGGLVVRGSGDEPSRQILDVNVEKGAALCYLPDPSVPYRDSAYEQVQVFTVDEAVLKGGRDASGGGGSSSKSSVCILDWVTQGRAACGEDWDFHLWKGKNEVWTKSRDGKRRLLLRDSVILDDGTRRRRDTTTSSEKEETEPSTSIRNQTSPHGIVGTFILHGPIFEPVGSFFMKEFTSQPRIGGRDWSSPKSSNKTVGKEPPSKEKQNRRGDQDVTWTAAHVRSSFVLVKFGAKDFESARDWLGGMLREEGTVAREFGEEALACLR
ncbi:hypothetical protein FQN54_003243 [Arachnomyces sp. PD_36]|nr:hypothetical protein FQN54_003243 [Arachnomyces sp. PD_36]